MVGSGCATGDEAFKIDIQHRVKGRHAIYGFQGDRQLSFKYLPEIINTCLVILR